MPLFRSATLDTVPMHTLSTRRMALQMLAGALSVLPLPQGLGLHAQEPARTGPLLPFLRQRFADQIALHAAAEAYFSQYPAESGLMRLCSLLLDRIGPCPADRLPDRLNQCATREFAAGDVVLVGGWVLARCEARLLAAASLVTTGV
jgi:hypothetical protein